MIICDRCKRKVELENTIKREWETVCKDCIITDLNYEQPDIFSLPVQHRRWKLQRLIEWVIG